MKQQDVVDKGPLLRIGSLVKQDCFASQDDKRNTLQDAVNDGPLLRIGELSKTGLFY